MCIVACRIIIISSAPFQPIGRIGIIGSVVWLIGFCFETISDLQLIRFKKETGKVQFELYKQRTNMFIPWFPKKTQKDIKI